MRYQVGEWAWCEVRQKLNGERYIIESQEFQSFYQWKKIWEEKFLIIGYAEGRDLPYLLLVTDEKIESCRVNSYDEFNYDVKYAEQRAWSVAEDRILRVEPVIFYGGKCRKCGDYNEYAEVDRERMFTCYRCRK